MIGWFTSMSPFLPSQLPAHTRPLRMSGVFHEALGLLAKAIELVTWSNGSGGTGVFLRLDT